MSIRVAFVGAGNMSKEHLRAFADIDGVELSGIYSRSNEKAKILAKEFQITNVCSTISELYQITEAHLVIISVSELSVRDVCFEAFQFPWICLIEKPAGYNFEDAAQIVESAEKNNAKAYVGLNRRHYSSTRCIVDDLSQTQQQRLIHVYDQESPKAVLSMGRDPLVVKNWMYANSIHMIDYLTFLGRGNILSVEPIIEWTSDNPGFVMAKITYESGDIGIYEAVWDCPGPWALTVTTHDKRWELRPMEKAFVQPYGSRKLESVEESDWDKNFKPGLRLQAEEAIKAVQGQQHQLPTINQALETMRVVKMIYE